jgi:hypothetical protein
MARDEQLKWEERAALPAALAALLSVVLAVGAGIYLGNSIPTAHNDLERVRNFATHPGDLMVGSVLQGLSTALLAVVLWYLYRATRARRPETPSIALPLAIAGPVFLGIMSIVGQARANHLGDRFEALPRDAQTIARAKDLLAEQNWLVIAPAAAAAVATAVALIMISLNAMRAGLLSRFMGSLGAVIGVVYALSIALAGGAGFLQLFWLPALAALFLGKWPGGRGPAWDSGEALPWPTAADRRAEFEAAQAAQAASTEQAAPVSGNGEAALDVQKPGPRPAKRKRKRR